MEHLEVGRLLRLVVRGVHELELSRLRDDNVGRAVLVAESVTADNDRLGPSWILESSSVQPLYMGRVTSERSAMQTGSGRAKKRVGLPGTALGTFSTMIGSRKTVPPRMLRIVPLGDCRCERQQDCPVRGRDDRGTSSRQPPLTFHIFFSLNSSTRASSGVMVAHCLRTGNQRLEDWRRARGGSP